MIEFEQFITSWASFFIVVAFISFIGSILMRYAIWRFQMNEYWKMLEMIANSIDRLTEEIKDKAL